MKKRKKRDLSAENINRFIKYFTSIYGDNGKEIPDNRRVTVWCDNNNGTSGFAVNETTDTMGLNQLIALCWIYQTDLNKLIDANA